MEGAIIMIQIPEKVKHYLENEENIPLVEVDRTRWYYISQEEKDILAQFVIDIDKIPEKVWRNYPEDVIWKFSCMGNLADRVVRNCIVREVEKKL